MKELEITITLPKGFGGVAVKTVIKQSGEGKHSHGAGGSGTDSGEYGFRDG